MARLGHWYVYAYTFPLNFAHALTFLWTLSLTLDGILSIHDHSDGDEAEGEDGVESERYPQQGHAQHRRQHKLQRTREGFQYRVELLEK